jgi:hypothetical protein
MAHENCILLSHATDLKAVHERLSIAFGPESLQIEGPPDLWTRITLTRRKLLRKVSVTFVPLPPPQLEEAQRRLKHVYQSIPAENPAILTKLLAKIATSRLGIDIQASAGLRGLEEPVFMVAEVLDAIIFWQGSKMLDKKGRLILDFEGRSGVRDLEVLVDAALLDQHTPVTEAGMARKERTEAVLKGRKIPFVRTLPPIEGEEVAQIRPVEEVVGRALALMLVAVKAEGLEDEIVQRVMADFGIDAFLSPDERAFIADPAPDQQSTINFLWRYEGLWVMLWALGYIEELSFPDQICDVPRSVTIIRESGGHAGFLAGSKLRTTAGILDQCDLAYRLNWAVTDARLRGEPAPANMEAGVVYERHYALNWLRCYLDQDWDDVRADT